MPSISEIVSAGRWDKALFLTYTLSLTYFESTVFRDLRESGCADIWIVTDAEGYRSSLMERHSWHMGRDYRVVPVALPDGVCHAKCIYLWGPDGDRLLVGSGNLTFGGHGRNLEVFEDLGYAAHADAFFDFAEFLLDIDARPDVQVADRGWIHGFSERALEMSEAGGSAGDGPRLVHSVRVPVLDAVRRAAAGLGRVDSVTVLSPFHDRTGAAVRRLAEGVSARRVNVAMTETRQTVFPFSAAGAWPSLDVRAVKLKVDGGRRLHAKWLEVRGEEEAVVVTGSVNATSKALCSTDNIEIGVLRRERAETSRLDIVEIDPPEENLAEPLAAGLGRNEVVHASFREDGALVGFLLSLQPTAGVWKGALVRPNGERHEQAITVEENGRFIVPSGVFDGLVGKDAVQIVLERSEGRLARGWVHMEAVLGMDIKRRVVHSALNRMMDGTDTGDDIRPLLEELAKAFSGRGEMDETVLRAAGHKSQPGEDDEVYIDIARLTGDGTADDRHAQGPVSLESSPDALFAEIKRALLGHKRRPQETAGPAGGSVVWSEDAGDARRAEKIRRDLAKTLHKWEEDAVAALDRPDVPASRKRSILTGLYAAGIRVRAKELDDAAGAHAFLVDWLPRAAAAGVAGEMTMLEQMLVTAMAIDIALSGTENDRPMRHHEKLELFYRSAVDPDRVRRALIRDLHVGFADLLDKAMTAADLEDAVETALRAVTRRRQIEAANEEIAAGKGVPWEHPMFAGETGKAFGAALEHGRVREACSDGRAMCMHCYLSLGDAGGHDLAHRRYAQCPNCKKFTVRLVP